MGLKYIQLNEMKLMTCSICQVKRQMIRLCTFHTHKQTICDIYICDFPQLCVLVVFIDEEMMVWFGAALAINLVKAI